jgi:hypothetical protein
MEINLLKLPAVYVNLDHDTARKEQTEKELFRWGHFNFVRSPGHYRQEGWWPWRGQSNAYAEACSIYQAPFILFEDDILLHNPITEVTVPEDADVLYLGGQDNIYVDPDSKSYVNFRAEKTGIDGIVKVRHIQTNHAVAFLSQKAVDEFLELLKDDLRADVILCKMSEKYNFYAVQPVVFSQNDAREGYGVHNSYTRVTNYLTGEKF